MTGFGVSKRNSGFWIHFCCMLASGNRTKWPQLKLSITVNSTHMHTNHSNVCMLLIFNMHCTNASFGASEMSFWQRRSGFGLIGKPRFCWMLANRNRMTGCIEHSLDAQLQSKQQYWQYRYRKIYAFYWYFKCFVIMAGLVLPKRNSGFRIHFCWVLADGNRTKWRLLGQQFTAYFSH